MLGWAKHYFPPLWVLSALPLRVRKKEKCQRHASESQGRVTHDPEKCEFGLLILLSDLETFQRRTFSEVFGSRTNWVSLQAGCKTNLWKGEKEKNLLRISLKETHLPLLSPQDDMPLKGRLWTIPQPWHAAGRHKHYWIRQKVQIFTEM